MQVTQILSLNILGITSEFSFFCSSFCSKSFFENWIEGDFSNLENVSTFANANSSFEKKMVGFNYALTNTSLTGEQIINLVGEDIDSVLNLIQNQDFEEALRLLVNQYGKLNEEGQNFLNQFFDFISDDIAELEGIELPEISNESTDVFVSEYRGDIQNAYDNLRAISQNSEANIQDLVDSYLVLNNLFKQYETTINSVDQIDPVVQAIMDTTEEGSTILQEYISVSQALSGANKKAISGWRDSVQVNKQAWSTIEDNNNLLILSNAAIDDYYQQVGNNEPIDQWLANNNKPLQEIDKQWVEFGQKLQNENLLTKFNSMYEDVDSYNLQDFSMVFGPIFEEADSEIINRITARYQALSQIIRDRLNGKINTALNKNYESSALRTLSRFINSTDLTADDEKLINASIEQIQKLEQLGFNKQAQTVAGQTQLLINRTENLSETFSNYYLDLINSNGLSAKENIEATINEIQNDKNLTNDEKQQLIEPLLKIQDIIINNLGLSVTTLLDNFAQDYDDFSKNFSKISSGMSLKELNDFFDKAANLKTNYDFTSEISQIGDKFTLSAEGQQAYWKAYIATVDAQIDTLNDSVTQGTDVLEQLKDQYTVLSNKSLTELKTSKESYKLSDYEKELAQSLGILNDKSNYQESDLTGAVTLTATGIVALYEAIEQVGEDFNQLTYLRSAAEKIINQQNDWDQGKYDSYFNEIATEYNITLEEIWEAIFNPSLINATAQPKLLSLAQQINSSYDTLITDVLSKGFNNINLDNYKGLTNGAQDIDISLNYQDFITRYASLAGKSVEETNALLIQAIEKDTQSTTGAAAAAIKNINWRNMQEGYASAADIQSLADALGISVTKILGAYNAELDAYEVDVSGIDLSQVDNFTDTVKDSINAFIKEIFENVNKFITGKLTHTDITTLKGQLESLGLNNLQLDFTETVDGLKLSQNSAIALYNELKKIDALQAQLVFDELSKSLESNNENYANISSTLKRIADLQNAISELKPGDARLKMYQDELAVAQEIARTRSSTDNKDFDFMSRSLPNGMILPVRLIKL